MDFTKFEEKNIHFYYFDGLIFFWDAIFESLYFYYEQKFFLKNPIGSLMIFFFFLEKNNVS